MKMLIAAVAFANLIAGPVYAQSWDPDLGTGNIDPAHGYSTPAPDANQSQR